MSVAYSSHSNWPELTSVVVNVNDGAYIVSGRKKGEVLVELTVKEYTVEEQEEGEREFEELD